MSTIQEIFKTYGAEYLSLYADKMPLEHKKVMRAITECHGGKYGTSVYECDECACTHDLLCSCGNRHCPSCQQQKSQNWLQKQMDNLLPTNYFLITFTIPKELRMIVRSNQRVLYKAMFDSAYQSLKKLAKDKRFLGTDHLGCIATLHTWGGNLQYHPHLHFIVPAGALSNEKDKWINSRQDLFVHTKPLAKIFSAKFRDAMIKYELFDYVDSSVWFKDWVIDSQAVGKGHDSFRYLARYTFRVAISNNRIISFDNHEVKFRYKDKVNKKWKTMMVDAIEFIRRFLQHVLPTGFMHPSSIVLTK